MANNFKKRSRYTILVVVFPERIHEVAPENLHSALHQLTHLKLMTENGDQQREGYQGLPRAPMQTLLQRWGHALLLVYNIIFIEILLWSVRSTRQTFLG